MEDLHADASPARMGSSGTYVYEALETPTTVRIFRLEPGDHGSPLVGRIFHTDLGQIRADEDVHFAEAWERATLPAVETFTNFTDRNHHSMRRPGSWPPRTWVPYEALSYVWGQSKYDHTIASPDGTMHVTPNLAKALEALRDGRLARNVWADSICINQRDIVEREQQVKMMGRIYSSAEGVLIWLGPDTESSARSVFQCLANLEIYNANAFAKLLTLGWFSRVWVLQEYLLARQAIFVWGKEQLSSSRLQSYVWAHNDKYGDKSLAWLFDSRLGVSDMLQTMRDRHCFDNRDRIYGLLGLQHNPDLVLSKTISTIVPDYTVDVDNLYTDFASLCIEHHEMAHILKHVVYDKTERSNLPSWVPDWRLANDSSPFNFMFDRPITQEHPGFYGVYVEQALGLLSIPTVVISRVQSVMKTDIDCNAPFKTLESICAYWTRKIKPLRRSPSYVRLETEFARLVGTRLSIHRIHFKNSTWQWLASNLFPHLEEKAPRTFLQYIKRRSHVRDMLSSFIQSMTTTWASWPWLGPQHWRGRRIFQLDGGSTGLGPAGMRSGDLLVLFTATPGYSYPLPAIIRECGDEYIFIGIPFVPSLYLDYATESSNPLGGMHVLSQQWERLAGGVREFRIR